MQVRNLIFTAMAMWCAGAYGTPAPQPAVVPPIAAVQAQPASYAQKIRAAILPHIAFSIECDGNPVAEVKVTTRPDGEVVEAELIGTSGNEDWDRAVRRAVLKAGRIPLDINGKVPSVLIISFRPKP